MSFSNEQIGGGNDGGIFNLHAELPMWLDYTQIMAALGQIDADVTAIKTPPVAEVQLATESVTPLEEFRKFYVEFNERATIEDVMAAVQIVGDAVKKYRYHY